MSLKIVTSFYFVNLEIELPYLEASGFKDTFSCGSV